MKDVDRFADSGTPPVLPFDLKVLLLYGVARHRVMLATLVTLGAVVGVLVGASQPNVYTAVGKLRYQASARQLLSDESLLGIADPDGVARRRTGSGIPDLLELLRDPVIYEDVVAKLGAREVLRVEDPSKTNENAGAAARVMHQLQGLIIRLKGLDDPCPGGEGPLCVDAAIETLMKGVVLVPLKDTSIVDVRYTATSPEKAQRILDALIEAYLAHHLEVYGATAKLEQLKDQFEVEHQKLNRLNQEYKEYQMQCGFFDIDGDYTSTIDAIRARDDSIRLQEIEAKRLEQYVLTLDEQLSGENSALGGQALNPTWVALVNRRTNARATIAELEVLDELSTTQSRSLAAARKELEVVEKQLEGVAQSTNDPFEMALAAQNNPVIAEARLELATSKAKLASVANQVAAEKAEKQRLERRLEAIRECQPQHDLHRAGIAATQLKFSRLSQQIPELDSLALLDQEGRSNLTLFRAPALPRDKDGPQRSKPLGIGLFGGLGLGVALAALRQLLDRRIRYRETVEGALGLPVLCVVPEMKALADGRIAA